MNLEYCIITASTPDQAAVFSSLVGDRQKAGLYPKEIGFFICCDPPQGRVGSGGGTLYALRKFLDSVAPDEDAARFLRSHSLVMIHAGGESRRLPCYIPEGKLFAPVPASSGSLFSPCILDLELALYLKYPWVQGELVVASGDVIIDFDVDTLQLPVNDAITGIAAPESFEAGSRHGVFIFDPVSGMVTDYVQKASTDVLSRTARIEGTDACALDLGIVSFRGSALVDLYSLLSVKTKTGTIESRLGNALFSCDLYLELLTACLDTVSREDYHARVSSRSRLDTDDLDVLYDVFHPVGLSGRIARRHSFVHFGSLREYAHACLEQRERGLVPFYATEREELFPTVDASIIVCNSVNIEVKVPDPRFCEIPVYVENCRNLKLQAEGGNLLVGLADCTLHAPLPFGICLDERVLGDCSRIRLIYGIGDTFKPVASLDDCVFCGKNLVLWLGERDLTLSDLGDGSEMAMPSDLYALKLFVPGVTSVDFLEGYWSIPSDPAAWRKFFLESPRLCLLEVNQATDILARDNLRKETRVLMFGSSLASIPFASLGMDVIRALTGMNADISILEKRCLATEDPLLLSYRSEVLRRAGSIQVSASTRVPVQFWSGMQNPHLSISVKQDQIVWARSSVRFDLAGGWTDTPPYTNRYGGSVVNVAVDLNGQSPIQVFVRRMPEHLVRVHSIDLGISEDIVSVRDLRSYKDPTKAFALPRAALVLLGLDSGLSDADILAPRLAAIGGGLEITLMCAVPKGSGLGTSSILAGVIVAALERFFSISSTQSDMFLKVLEMEQMLSTGGGWQDQIGGLVGGLKYCESRPGNRPQPIIHQLDSWIFEDPRMHRRMTLFYTGITRLAKNILSEVVSRVNSMDRAFLYTHAQLKHLAFEARNAISLRDYPDLARVVGKSFEENKLIHASTSNEFIDALESETRQYYSGMKLLGAGGGGFALFLSPDEKAAETLQSVLASRFEDDRARLVDFSLSRNGLQVTVS